MSCNIVIHELLLYNINIQYYITLEVGVNSLESDCNVEKKLRKSACATIGFHYDFIAVRGIV